MFVSLIGTWIQGVAQSWLVFQLTNSAFLLGVVGFLSYIPVFLFSLFGGVLADRANRRNILIFTQTAFMFLAFLLAVLTQFKLVTPLQIMFIAGLNGLVMAFDAPARQAVVVDLVGKTHLLNAIAINSIAFNSSRIIGPALAGILIAAIGMSGCFYINGISFLAVIIALFLIKLNSNSRKHENKTPLRDLKEGFFFIKDHHLIKIMIMMVGFVSLFGIPYILLMPVFAKDVLKVGVKGLAILMSSVGLGALIGGLILARLGDFKYKGKLLILSCFVFSIFLILFSLSKIYLLSIVALVFTGAASVTAVSLINTILQIKVPDGFRGRVMSAFMLTFAGFMPFGNLIAGSLSQAFGVSLVVLFNGALCAAFFTVINLLYPEIRNI